MCRLAAYSGPPIPLERIVIAPRHSLLEQSQSATEAKLAVNGDGFGIAWYGDDERPGLYRDVLPAWSDGNLPSICRLVKSHMFLAHVRASTTGETSRVNCHPFTYKNWSFAHNGQIGNFVLIRRQLEANLPDELYNIRRGTTDSELLFLLLLSNGLEANPKRACEQVISLLSQMQRNECEPTRLACVFSDGISLYGFRHSSDQKSPTLYLSSRLDSGGHAIASEPLDGNGALWTSVSENQFVALNDGVFTQQELTVTQNYEINQNIAVA